MFDFLVDIWICCFFNNFEKFNIYLDIKIVYRFVLRI